MSERYLLIAGLLDPFVCLELIFAHLFFMLIIARHFREKYQLSQGLAWSSSLGCVSLIALINLALFYLLGLRFIQEPVVMWYTP